MNYKELEDFRVQVAEPRMKEILEKTEIPEGLCCIDSLEFQLLDCRSCGVDSRVIAMGLVYKGGQVEEYVFDEVDVSAEAFVELFEGCVFPADGVFTVKDEVNEVEITTNMRSKLFCYKVFSELESLEKLQVVGDYLPFIKMQHLYEERMAQEAQSIDAIVGDAQLRSVAPQGESGKEQLEKAYLMDN